MNEYDPHQDCDDEWHDRVLALIRDSDEWARVYRVIEDHQEQLEMMEDPDGLYYQETASALRDADEEANDPYGYRGLSRGDF